MARTGTDRRQFQKWPGLFCVDERFSTEIDDRNYYNSKNSADSSGSGSDSAQKILGLYRTSGGAV